MCNEVGGEDAAEVRFRRAIGRAVVVRQIEVRDADVERPLADFALRVPRPIVAEVVPQTQ